MSNSGKDASSISKGGQSLTEISDVQSLSVETIDLSTLFVNEVSSSGSFDLRQSRLGFFEKFLEAMPIPSLLVNESCQVAFANRACNRVAGDRGKIEGHHFKLLFPSSADGLRAEKLIDKVLHNRIPLVAEGVLGMDQIRVRGRIHMRSLRVRNVRTVLVVIENLVFSAEQP
ncbi:MAG: hypothetical protein HY912_24295 [Desulfomonile tiedjei]|uniref:PAS domain-containing protein n=1 Tax=Desulfomonile tiedjei TaxID=2358 RepID=A0A9D6Z5Y3_9BACT|nr:hypothetical protein [Desulfomonile tiedjei]